MVNCTLYAERRPNSLTESDPENYVPEQTIRNRAHEIYNERGGETGHDVEAATRAV